MYDLRPKETAPSLVNFQRMPIEKLRGLLAMAYKKQLAALKQVETEGKQYDRQSEIEIKSSVTNKLSMLKKCL